MFAEDFDIYLDDFGVEATFKGQPIRCIFDRQYFEIPAGEAGMQSSQPQALCKDADVIGAAQGEAFDIGAVTFRIVGIEPDGTGMTLLRLEKQ
jgi:hypothetical protein